MTTQALERAIEALIDRAGYTEYGPVVPPSLAPELARAVLMAVRSGQDVIDAGVMTQGDFNAWQNTIDAILGEGEGE